MEYSNVIFLFFFQHALFLIDDWLILLTWSFLIDVASTRL